MNKLSTSKILMRLISISIKKQEASEEAYFDQMKNEIKNIDALLIDDYNEEQSVLKDAMINEIINPSSASD
ncbi:hypothetical protein ACE939_04555 [Aquimarina sp. W85]|uniref:hypothetical protein n=1 Tax=Aquimarina rhodophyticola TaxID=3342246 RepID=UPI003672F53A